MKRLVMPYRLIICTGAAARNFAPARLPLLTMGLALAATLQFRDNGGAGLQYDRAAIAGGEFWRLAGGHLSHWSPDHFRWCALVFVLAGVLAEGISRRGFLLTLAGAGALIPAAVWFLLPEMAFYRGLSGLASGLFVFAALRLAQARHLAREWGWFWFFTGLCLLFLGKLALEAFSGAAIFVEATDLFTPVPLVHLIGGMVGAVISLLDLRQGRGGMNVSSRKQGPLAGGSGAAPAPPGKVLRRQR